MNLTKEEILEKHLGGKLSVELKNKLINQKDLSIAYTPGVAKVCLEIKENPDSIYNYTCKKNSVAVVTDGTAVLGLGNIGPRASIPVMEGKAVLFKRFGKVDSWPVPLENVKFEDGKTNPKKVIEAVKQIACMYGGINLEDIAAPACFEIEETLENELDIPVFHDDQWGTAIIVLAAIKNYCILSEKKIEDLKIIVNGAGAAGIRICDMLKNAGAQNLFLIDSKGVVNNSRTDLNPYKQKHSRETNSKTLSQAIQNADVFIGVSVADCLTKEMVQTMNEFPAIFAMANPNPEITPEEVKEALGNKDYVMATGRSDYPNQINNVLGFPYIFRGALDARARNITMKMKIAASEALAELARDPFIPDEVQQAYQRDFKFSKDYIIPTPFDPRLLEKVGGAVRRAVEEYKQEFSYNNSYKSLNFNLNIMVKKIITLGINLNNEQKKRLTLIGEVKEFESPESVEDFLNKTECADVIFSNGDFLLESLPKLKNVFVTYPYVELGLFNSEELEKNGVFVANAQGGNRDSIVEWVMYMILSLFRKFTPMVRATENFPVELQETLQGKKVLIVGHGSIGSQVGVLCNSFGMKVSFFERGDDLTSSSKEVDLIINSLNCNSTSKNLLDEDFFMNLKKGCYYLTFARPYTYDIDGLIKSIEKGIIAGAAIDCDPEGFGDTQNAFYKRALSNSKILVTPHIAFSTKQAIANGREIAIQNIEAFLEGKPKNILKKK